MLNLQLKSTGYVVVKNIFTKAEIDDYESYIVNLSKKYNKKIFTNVDLANNHLEFLLKIIKNPEFKKISEEILGSNDLKFLRHSDIICNDRNAGGNWHRDCQTFKKYENCHNNFRACIYTRYNILKAIPYSHIYSSGEFKNKSIICKCNLDTDACTCGWDLDNDSIDIITEPGDILFFNPILLHRSVAINTFPGNITNKFIIYLSMGINNDYCKIYSNNKGFNLRGYKEYSDKTVKILKDNNLFI